MTTVTIQQNVGGYTGTTDTHVRASRPTREYGNAGTVSVDGADSSGTPIQGLLSFANIFGDGPGQIPLGSTITSATLSVAVSNGTGNPVSFYRMAQDWTAMASWTWNSFGAGIQTDGTEALSTADVTVSGLGTGTQTINVMSSLQAWADGAANFGWLLSIGGTDGLAFSSANSTSAPVLTVTYDAPPPPPGLDVVETGGTTVVTEGGADDTLLIALRSAPTADVTITISTTGTDDISIVQTVLTFTAANWQTQQTVLLSAINDSLVEAPESFTVTLTATSADAAYDGLSSVVTVGVTDDDVAPPPPGLDVVETGGTTVVTEGGADDTLLIALRSAPTADVTITISTTGTDDISIVQTVLTFTAANWQTQQTVLLSAINDSLVEAPESFTVTMTATSADIGYDGLSSNVTVGVTDNDVPAPPPGLNVVQSGGTTVVTEGGAGDTFVFALNSAPTSDVTITLTTTGTNDISIAQTVMTFTAANWQTQQTVLLGAINDSLIEGPESFAVTMTATSADAGYNGLSSNVTVGVTDNDSYPTVLSPAVLNIRNTTLYTAGDASSRPGCGDPSGIAYVPGLNQLYIVDSEHDETPYNSQTNLFVTTLAGTHVGSFSMRAFTREPTGIAYNKFNGLLYISDDDARRIFVIDPTNPTVLISSINLAPYGILDAEDPEIDPVTGHIFLLDGSARKLVELTETGAFISATTLPSAILDAEALAYDPIRDVFYIGSGATRGTIFQTDREGHILATINLLNTYTHPETGSKPKIKGMELAPSSDPNDGDRMSLYVCDYGSDQVMDGRVFEVDLYYGWLGA